MEQAHSFLLQDAMNHLLPATGEQHPPSILITGARKFSDDAPALAAAKEMLHEMFSLSPADTVVMHGGANGIDSLAGHVALALGRTTLEFPAYSTAVARTRRVLSTGEILSERTHDWTTFLTGGAARYYTTESRRKPLLRNEGMVNYLAQRNQLADGTLLEGDIPNAICVGFTHYLSQTGGTIDTLRKARSAKIRTFHVDWRITTNGKPPTLAILSDY